MSTLFVDKAIKMNEMKCCLAKWTVENATMQEIGRGRQYGWKSQYYVMKKDGKMGRMECKHMPAKNGFDRPRFSDSLTESP